MSNMRSGFSALPLDASVRDASPNAQTTLLISSAAFANWSHIAEFSSGTSMVGVENFD